MDLVRCPRCAKQIPTMARFCGRCGCAVGRVGAVGGFGVQAPPPVPSGRGSVKGYIDVDRRRRGMVQPPPPPAKSGSGIGIFILIAIVAALIAMSSRHSSRPRSAPAPIRHYQRAPVKERLNSAPWNLKIEKSASGRVSSSLEYRRSPVPGSSPAKGSSANAKASKDEVIDRVIRKASEYLDRIEADRGAVHKGRASVDCAMLP